MVKKAEVKNLLESSRNFWGPVQLGGSDVEGLGG